VKTYTAAALLVATLGLPLLAQEKPAPAANTAPAPGGATVRVQLVVSRYQGEKKVSSLPYLLTVNTDERSRTGKGGLRLGTQIPVPMTSYDKEGKPAASMQYRDVGTNIDCFVTAMEEGRFKLDLTIEDSSIDTSPGSAAGAAAPAFKSFRTNDSMILKDGQSNQLSTATDKVSGDVWKVDVTLTVVK
jgi:type II secretory pathway component GspD/PulD (secretin)